MLLLPRIVVARPAVDGDPDQGSQVPVAEKPSLLPFAQDQLGRADVERERAGSRRSKRTCMPFAVVVKTSAPPPRLTSTVLRRCHLR